MSGSRVPLCQPLVLDAASASFSDVERLKRAVLIYLPAAACSKREQIDNFLRSNDEPYLEAACRPSTP